MTKYIDCDIFCRISVVGSASTTTTRQYNQQKMTWFTSLLWGSPPETVRSDLSRHRTSAFSHKIYLHTNDFGFHGFPPSGPFDYIDIANIKTVTINIGPHCPLFNTSDCQKSLSKIHKDFLIPVPWAFLARFDRYMQLFQYIACSSQIVVALKC